MALSIVQTMHVLAVFFFAAAAAAAGLTLQ